MTGGKTWKNTKAQRDGGRSDRGSRLGPSGELSPTIQPGHSISERMLMRLLWSFWCFPCFQHLQGPHGAHSIKTAKWEIWAFFCDAGGLLAFQPGRPFSPPHQNGRIRKTVLQGVWMGTLKKKKKNAFCEQDVIINLCPCEDEALDTRRIAGWEKKKGRVKRRKRDAQIWILFLKNRCNEITNILSRPPLWQPNNRPPDERWMGVGSRWPVQRHFNSTTLEEKFLGSSLY